MAFGPRMWVGVGELNIELAPLSREAMVSFIEPGLQQASVNRFLMRTTSPVLEDEYEWFERLRSQQDSIVWGIWVRAGDDTILIGDTTLHHISRWPSSCATSGSLIFRKEYWGKGIASSIHKARTWYAFRYLGLECIRSAVIQGNVASRRALEGSGYAVVSTKRNVSFVDGSRHHQDDLECINPSPGPWRSWWGDDRPPRRARDARVRADRALEWATSHVILL